MISEALAAYKTRDSKWEWAISATCLACAEVVDPDDEPRPVLVEERNTPARQVWQGLYPSQGLMDPTDVDAFLRKAFVCTSPC